MSATNKFYFIFSKFNIICENGDIKKLVHQDSTNIKFAILPLGQKKKNPTSLESIALDVSIKCALQ